MWARVTAPLYAVGEGIVVGAISKVYESQYDGIVSQAVVATIGVFAVMLFLYASRIIKVTDKLRMIIVCATVAICLVYVFDFGHAACSARTFPFLHDTGVHRHRHQRGDRRRRRLQPAARLRLHRAGRRRPGPKAMEWYAGFGLLITLVWLYLELLRLLSKLAAPF